jgi:hypothetical protein
VAPLSAESYAVQFTMDKESHETLRQIQDLLGPRVARGDLATIFGNALKLYRAQLEKRRFAVTERPKKPSRRASRNIRHVPAAVRRAVHRRDGGRCTYVSESGHRCEARGFVDMDHIDFVALGGKATVDKIRLLCPAHNQFAAEQKFGTAFMNSKRERARRAAELKRAHAAREQAHDVMTALRELGYSGEKARHATAHCMTTEGATLEDRVKAALRWLCPKARTLANSPPTRL